ncbi:MAG: RNA recognition motif domain-containing protein [Holosporales bacterium]
MSQELFVGNLPFSATEESLSQHFAACGEVEQVKIIRDRETGRSRGFGFVKMASGDAAQKAVASLNGQDYSGRPLRVNIAEGERRAPAGGGNGGFRGGPRRG